MAGSYGKAENAVRQQTIDRILRENPEVIRLVNARDMLCVGCQLAPFHDLHDAALAHDIDEEELVEAVLEAIRPKTTR